MNPARSASDAEPDALAERAPSIADVYDGLAYARPPRAYLDARFEAVALELAGHFAHLDVEELEGDERSLG